MKTRFKQYYVIKTGRRSYLQVGPRLTVFQWWLAAVYAAVVIAVFIYVFQVRELFGPAWRYW